MEVHLRKGARKLAANLDTEFSYSVAHHNFELGLPLENALKGFLRNYFPSRYGFGTGYLVDRAGRVSNQSDWIIYDSTNFAPLICKAQETDSVEFFAYDSAYAVVEVKRTLSEAVLRTAVEQLQRNSRSGEKGGISCRHFSLAQHRSNANVAFG